MKDELHDPTTIADPTEPTAEPAPAPEKSDAAPQAVDLSDDALVTVKIGGKVEQMRFGDAKRHIQIGSYNDRRAQQIAEERKAFDAERAKAAEQAKEYETRVQEIRGILADPQKLMALYMAAQARQTQPTQPTPLTAEDLPSLQQQLEQRQQAHFEKLRQEWEGKQRHEAMTQAVSQVTSTAIAKHPVLRAIPGIEATVYDRAVKLAPEGGYASMDDAKATIESIAAEAAAAVRKSMEDEAKAAAAEKAKALQHGIEPKGGSGVFPAPMSLKTRRDREDAVKAALAALE